MALIYAMTSLLNNKKNVDDLLPLMEAGAPEEFW